MSESEYHEFIDLLRYHTYHVAQTKSYFEFDQKLLSILKQLKNEYKMK